MVAVLLIGANTNSCLSLSMVSLVAILLKICLHFDVCVYFCIC